MIAWSRSLPECSKRFSRPATVVSKSPSCCTVLAWSWCVRLLRRGRQQVHQLVGDEIGSGGRVVEIACQHLAVADQLLPEAGVARDQVGELVLARDSVLLQVGTDL